MSPLGTPILSTYIYFLDTDIELKYPFLTLKFIPGRYTSLVIVEIIKKVIKLYKIE